MTRAFQAVTAEPWAIEPSWLPLLAAIASRNQSGPEIDAAKDWQKRDFDLMAGPTAQRLAGASRTYVAGGVAILPITGPIFPRANMMTEMSGATSITMLHNDYRAALDNKDVGAILLLMDTPGGAVSGINGFADAVAAGALKKMTVAHVVGSAASAGYWIASAANEITIERTALVGSIGVVSAVPKQVEPDADGEMLIEIVSTNAPNKRPDPSTEDGRGEIVAVLDAIEQQFVADVAKGRKTSVDKVIADFGKGGVKVGKAAVSAGMADKVQSQETTLAGLQRMVRNQQRLADLKR
ncbi:S49 family peptidase [Mesorhizobium sp. B2-4-6]|uniref:S49 family peptidase n=1 Tax=Mesorhizobium sp. B2-4-6 TaxID=2589943 RepID=UPI00112C3A68|nr:S49 family peptidase [Mesorhizobium sp. B2-4-6]TPL40683.1 S49 family peptidase [Mesorhizobium sp. B2-4-6]